MQYLRATNELVLMIEPGDQPNWWVDRSYAVHPDMRSHSNIYMALGKVVTYRGSIKQKLNTKSSTEAELVDIDDAMGENCGHVMFSTTGRVPTTTVYQDNKRMILLAENGRTSSRNRTHLC